MAEWRDIRNWPGYEVSDDGRVRNRFGKELYIDRDRVGYLRVKLCRNGFRKNRRIHILVAQAFLRWRNNYDVNHKDRDKTNNRVGNLEMLTHARNCLHRWRTPAPAEVEEEPPF